MEEIHQEAFVSGAVSEVTGAVLIALDCACKPRPPSVCWHVV